MGLRLSAFAEQNSITAMMERISMSCILLKRHALDVTRYYVINRTWTTVRRPVELQVITYVMEITPLVVRIKFRIQINKNERKLIITK